MRKKITAILMVSAICLMLFAGCGSEEAGKQDLPDSSADAEAGETSAAPSAEPVPAGPEEILASYPKKDLGGYEFVINSYSDTFFTPAEITGPIEEAKDARNRMIEDYFNMKFVHRQTAPEAAFAEGQPAILGGDKYADMLAQTMWATSTFLANELLADLSAISTLHLDADYYNQQVRSSTAMNGKTYEIGGDANPELGYCYAFNKKIVEAAGVESPYELVKKNEWTFDKVRELCRAVTKDMNGDGVMTSADDRWGHCGPDGDYHRAMAVATGLPIVGKNDAGQMALLLDHPKWAEYLQVLNGFFKADGTFMEKEPGTNWDSIIPHWKSGRVLFLSGSVGGCMTQSRDMKDDWGIVPLPKAEKSQKNYGAMIDHNAAMVTMTVTNKNAEDTGMIIDAMYNLSSAMVAPIVLDTYAGLYLRDEESAEMLQLIYDSAYYDAVFFLRHGIQELNAATDMPVQVILGEKEFASGYEEIHGMVQDALDRFFRQGSHAE